MAELKDLVLPEMYEEVVQELGGADNINARLAEFVSPVQYAEEAIAVVAAQVRRAGRVVFILGAPGSGKSTFVHSLAWRPSSSVRAIETVNCSGIGIDQVLPHVLGHLRGLAREAVRLGDVGVTAVVIDYLESLDEQDATDVKAFFRTLNGILRGAPLLVIWPVVERADVDHMLQMAAAVSGTIFVRGREVVEFRGPLRERYSSIVKNTVAVLNDGLRHTDFNLTDEDLEEVKSELLDSGEANVTMRNYILGVRDRWATTNDYLAQIRAKVPKHTEIWFVVAYPGAEDTVSGFARKSKDVAEAWRANREKLSEYLHGNQREAAWSSKRLQYSLTGAFDTRIMFLPTNVVVAAAASYANKDWDFPPAGCDMPKGWSRKSTCRGFLQNSPVVRQLKGDPPKMGKRRGGTAAAAIKSAGPGYQELAARAAGQGDASDEPINHALAAALTDVLGDQVKSVVAEIPHPWLENIIPDVLVETLDGRLICLEMHYTQRTDDYVLAGYVLDKLDRYMRQLEGYITG